jgi:hypothetical protein
MTYALSLKLAALGAGLVLLLAGVFGWMRTDRRSEAPGLSRNRPLGVMSLLAAGAWTLWLLSGQLDLGEFSNYRDVLRVGTVLLTAGAVMFLPDFLLPRGVGVLLLLGADVLISAAFPDQRSIRLVVTVLAYAWAVAGMILVASPYHLRDWLGWAAASAARWRAVSGLVAGLGVVLVGLALFVY